MHYKSSIFFFEKVKEQIHKALATIIGLLRTLLMQNKEDIILTRIQRLDSSFIRKCFLLSSTGDGSADSETQQQEGIKTEQEAGRYFAQFILYFLDTTSKEIASSYHSLSADSEQVQALIPLLENFFVLLWYIAKSGLYNSFKKDVNINSFVLSYSDHSVILV